MHNRRKGIPTGRASVPLDKVQGGDHWDDVGTSQFRFLREQGLESHHRLLDIACGSFRGGRFLIDYLSDGHYFGIDGNQGAIQAGIKYVLRPQRLMRKHPTIEVVKFGTEPVHLESLLRFSGFDYVWIHALFDHIPPLVIRSVMEEANNVLAKGGRLLATIFLNPHGPSFREPMVRPRDGSLDRAVITYPDREYWHHTIDFFEELVSDIPGIEFRECLFDYEHPLGLRVLSFESSSSS